MKSLEKAILARALGFAKLVSLPHKFSSYFIKNNSNLFWESSETAKNSRCNYLSLHSYLRAAIGCIFAAVLAG